MSTLSLVMNTYNEDSMIEGAIASCPGVDEIVVADMGSTDETVAIAKHFGARVVTLPHSGFCETGRQAAIDAATSDWVIMLDGDERLCEGGIAQIRQLIANTPAGTVAYNISFHTYLGERRIMATGWEADRYEFHPRLFRRDKVTWPAIIHAVPTFDGVMEVLDPNGPLHVVHYNFRDLEHAFDKFNRYCTTESVHLAERGEAPQLARGLREGLEEFIRRYSPDQDGAMSFAMSFGLLGYKLMTHLKAAETQGWPEDETLPSKDTMAKAVNAFWSVYIGDTVLAARKEVQDKYEFDQNLSEAVGALRRLLSQWGENAGVLSDLGALEYLLGHKDAALTHCRRAVELEPANEDAKHNLTAIETAIHQTH